MWNAEIMAVQQIDDKLRVAVKITRDNQSFDKEYLLTTEEVDIDILKSLIRADTEAIDRFNDKKSVIKVGVIDLTKTPEFNEENI